MFLKSFKKCLTVSCICKVSKELIKHALRGQRDCSVCDGIVHTRQRRVKLPPYQE